MNVQLLRAKLKARVTSVNTDAPGCLGIIGMGVNVPFGRFEKVTVLNLTTRNRFDTFVYYPGEENTAEENAVKHISLNGDAAKYGNAGDDLIIESFWSLEKDFDYASRLYAPESVSEINPETGEITTVDYDSYFSDL